MEKLLLIVLSLSSILCCELFFTTPISFYLIVNFLNVVVFCLNEIDFNFLSAKPKKYFSYSAAWLKDIPVKEGDRVSVYISHPVPENIQVKEKC